MNLIDYLDFKTVFLQIKKNHLDVFPTPDSFKEYLKDLGEEYTFTDDLYNSFSMDIDQMSFPSSETHEYNIFRAHVDENLFDIELMTSGGQNYEEGYNLWCYGFVYTINLEEELFVNYYTENYS